MKTVTMAAGGQIPIPAEVRRIWGVQRVALEDLGDRLVVRPLPDDRIAAARGAFKGRVWSTKGLRAHARREGEAAEQRRR